MTKYLQLIWFNIQLLQLCSSIEIRPCTIRELQPSSSYVRALVERPRHLSGCVSQEVSAKSQTIQVIAVTGSSDVKSQAVTIAVDLLHSASSDNSKERIFVLASEQPIVWQILSDSSPGAFLGKFMVSNRSDIVHDRSLKLKVRKTVFPFGADLGRLESWVRGKWGAVTSIVYLPQPVTLIRLPVGSAPEANRTCYLGSNLPNNFYAGHDEEQPIRGCFSRRNERELSRVVHVIELASAVANSSADQQLLPVAELNIRSVASSGKKLKQSVVVLKSHQSVKWKVLTRWLRGSVDFITDQSLDSSGIHARHFRVTAERLSSLSGENLVTWAVEKYGPLTSYSFVEVANKIDLTINAEEKSTLTDVDLRPVSTTTERVVTDSDEGDRHMSASEKKRGFRRSIVRALSLSCKENSMRISIWKYPFMGYHIFSTNISLLDVSCQAVDSGSQFVLSTRYSDCGTFHSVANDGATLFANAVVVQPQVSKDARTSRSMREARMPIIINVSCHYLVQTNHKETGVQSSGAQFEMRLFRNTLYDQEITNFPYSLRAAEQLFVEILLTGDDTLNVAVQNCSIEVPSYQSESHTLNRWLIVNGCATGETVSWIKTENVSNDRHVQRFVVNFPTSWASESFASLRCSVAVCTQHLHRSFAGFERCSFGCDPSNDIAQLQPVARLAKGPLVLLPAEEDPDSHNTKINLPAVREIPTPAEVIQVAPETLPNKVVMEPLCSAVVIDGVTTGAVVGISFAAFFIGVVLMSSLWYIHVRTGINSPKKRIGLK